MRGPNFLSEKKQNRVRPISLQQRVEQQYTSWKSGMLVGAIGVAAFLQQPINTSRSLLHRFLVSELAAIALEYSFHNGIRSSARRDSLH